MSKFRLHAAKQRRNLGEGPIIPSSGNLQKPSKQIQINSTSPASLSPRPCLRTPKMLPAPVGQFDGGSMREVTRIVTTALAAAALSLAAAMPLVAAWRMPAEQSATQASIDAPGQQIQGLPLVY